LVGPRQVGLEITHFCNLKCSFCESHGSLLPAPVTQRRAYVGGRRTMDLETIARLARSMARSGVEWVELSGKGDPIVHPELVAIVGLLKDAGLKCSMFTNGTVVRPGLPEQLTEKGLDRLNLSLNAASRETYTRVTGRDLYDKAIDFVSTVLALRRRAGRARPWVRLTFVVCKDNVDDMEGSVELCRELGADEGGWCVMGELRETRPIQLDRAQVDVLQERLPEWRARLDAAGLAHNLEDFGEDLASRFESGQRQENPLQRELPCYEGWMHAVVAPDGTVAPCCYCENVVLGNVAEEDFEKVWTGERYQEFRRRSLAMPETQEPICNECFTTCNKAFENRRFHERLKPLAPLGRLAPGRNGSTAARPAPVPLHPAAGKPS
jgi:radical SAM protein with 4Fe4S-binding SPASM domain